MFKKRNKWQERYKELNTVRKSFCDKYNVNSLEEFMDNFHEDDIEEHKWRLSMIREEMVQMNRLLSELKLAKDHILEVVDKN